MIFWNENKPKLETMEDTPNTYYLIKPKKYGAMKAMCIDGEWWLDYTSKVMVEVVGWTDIND